jgi:hypothetical protein
MIEDSSAHCMREDTGLPVRVLKSCTAFIGGFTLGQFVIVNHPFVIAKI